jgi:hypothetical protein
MLSEFFLSSVRTGSSRRRTSVSRCSWSSLAFRSSSRRPRSRRVQLATLAFPRRVQRQHERDERPQEARNKPRPEGVTAIASNDEAAGEYADREKTYRDERRMRPGFLCRRIAGFSTLSLRPDKR